MLLWAALVLAQSPVTFVDFTSAGGLELVGSAKRVKGAIRLAPAKPQQAGAAWLDKKYPVRAGFEVSFQFRLTAQDGLGPGAVGLAFVIQSGDTLALAGRGGAAGFAAGDGWNDRMFPGIPQSIAVFFDTFYNEPWDPSGNYVAICANGQASDMQWPPKRLGVIPKLKQRLKDGKVHSVQVRYEPPLMSVFLDNPSNPVLVAPVDLSPVADQDGMAYIGFTAATGNGWQNHDLLNLSFRPRVTSDISSVDSQIRFHKIACLPDRNLCTPEHALVEQTSATEYHVILPAHIEWAASFSNLKELQGRIRNASGLVCWDLAAGSKGCGQPGPETLKAKVSDGKMHFTVHDVGGNYADNQGYFEFDVVLHQPSEQPPDRAP